MDVFDWDVFVLDCVELRVVGKLYAIQSRKVLLSCGAGVACIEYSRESLDVIDDVLRLCKADDPRLGPSM